MFLKRMEVRGFKSFAHPTTIEFTDGLTVVVGPNGSGKSNINDAFKWVLGEASKKNLRAANATDMIFSGSDTEKAADFAEVTLIFNNEDKILDIEYNEVSITRRSYRQDKQNDYFINKTLVRRRDVKDLFLGTGLGNTDLSIISQGSVTKITESKPHELRELLNEAAGVSRYQSQKEEAVRKLEKVTQSLDIFSVKLKELEKQVGPLKKKKDIAERYLGIKAELEKIELPIIKHDLTENIAAKQKYETMQSDSEIKKNVTEEKIAQTETKLRELQEKIISLDNELYSLQTKQNELNQQSIITEADEKGLEDAIGKAVKGIKDIKEIEKQNTDEQVELENRLRELRTEDFNLTNESDKLSQSINKADYEVSKSNKSRSGSVSRGTQAILDNRSIFDEIHGTVNELVKFDRKYETAVLSSVGNKLNNLVVSDEETVKEAVSFLKANKAGTATLIPAKKVKPRTIPAEYENAIKGLNGFEGTIATILRTDAKFKNVVKSIGGHLLVFSDIETGLAAAKMLGYKYEIVTLEGDQIFTGFTVKGGSNTKGGRIVELKKILEKLKAQHNIVKDKIYNKREEIASVRDTLSIKNTELARSKDRVDYLEANLQKLLDQYKVTTGKDFDMNSFENSQEYISKDLSIEQINSKIKTIQLEKQSVQKDIMSKQDDEHEFRAAWEEAINIHTESTLALNTISTSISKDLEILNKDYKMTFENLEAKSVAPLEISIEKATDLRAKFRQEISKLGFVDFDAIDSYEELFETYEELKENVTDLRESRDKLLSTIDTMDNQMITQFKDIFSKVNNRFQSVFSTLFRGGKATMHFTEPDNILETGVEIEAQLPGKTVKSLSLYSGGEKSLISLSLIFAINEVRNLPILMLDEVEAALDEANVDRFARFAKKLNETTQIVITSHRPGTMEQADVLYGVTMQTKGITNIVSVKLADAIEMSE